jgi:predicted tellurium resistance membrane protein TerC
VFISIAVGRLPKQKRSKARRIGLVLACGTRILLLLALAHLARLDDTRMKLFTLWGQVISVRDLIMIGGGLFLLVKGAMEIWDAIFAEPEEAHDNTGASTFAWVIAQIALIDIVFSLDSVFTAVGLARPDQVLIMAAAIVLAMIVMMWASGPVTALIERHPTIKVLALSFLVLIGSALIGQAVGLEVPKGYLYFAMGFAVAVELINIRVRGGNRPRARPDDEAAD